MPAPLPLDRPYFQDLQPSCFVKVANRSGNPTCKTKVSSILHYWQRLVNSLLASVLHRSRNSTNKSCGLALFQIIHNFVDDRVYSRRSRIPTAGPQRGDVRCVKVGTLNIVAVIVVQPDTLLFIPQHLITKIF